MDAEGHHTTLGARAGQICRGFWFLLIILFLQWIPYDERAFCENLGEHSHHLLAGTNIRDTEETCSEQHYKQHIIFGSTGEPPRGRQNTSGGVSIILRSRVFQRKNVSRVYSPPQALQGRFGAVRLRRGDLDVCAITVYMHTETAKADTTRAESPPLEVCGKFHFKTSTPVCSLAMFGRQCTCWL